MGAEESLSIFCILPSFIALHRREGYMACMGRQLHGKSRLVCHWNMSQTCQWPKGVGTGARMRKGDSIGTGSKYHGWDGLPQHGIAGMNRAEKAYLRNKGLCARRWHGSPYSIMLFNLSQVPHHRVPFPCETLSYKAMVAYGWIDHTSNMNSFLPHLLIIPTVGTVADSKSKAKIVNILHLIGIFD